MKTIMIPECMNPFEVIINGVKHSYPAGTEQEVPDEVAAVIENHVDGAHNVPRSAAGDYDVVVNVYYRGDDETGDFEQKVDLLAGDYATVKAKIEAGTPTTIKVVADVQRENGEAFREAYVDNLNWMYEPEEGESIGSYLVFPVIIYPDNSVDVSI